MLRSVEECVVEGCLRGERLDSWLSKIVWGEAKGLNFIYSITYTYYIHTYLPTYIHTYIISGCIGDVLVSNVVVLNP